jgi:allantoinase
VPGNAPQLAPMRAAGVLAFKCFLVPSGVAEFKHVTEADLREAFPILATLGAPLMVHAELPDELRAPPSGGSVGYAAYVDSRPPAAERAAIEMLVRLVEWCPVPVHIVHLSSAEGLAAVQAARARGLPITAETCPHYLYFEADEVTTGATEFKCAPPIRDRANREELWRGVEEGLFTAIVSDHSPCTPELKRMQEGDIARAWGGIASMQFGLPIVWTEAKRRKIAFEKIVELMTIGPATLAGLGHRKGKLAAGYDADIIAFDRDARFVVQTENVQHRHKVTPYAGETLTGVVRATYVRGHKVWEDGRHLGNAIGEWVRR